MLGLSKGLGPPENPTWPNRFLAGLRVGFGCYFRVRIGVGSYKYVTSELDFFYKRKPYSLLVFLCLPQLLSQVSISQNITVDSFLFYLYVCKSSFSLLLNQGLLSFSILFCSWVCFG